VNSMLSCKRALGALNCDIGQFVTGDRLTELAFHSDVHITADNGTNPAFDRVAGLTDDTYIETISFTLTIIVRAAIKKLKLSGASRTICAPVYQTGRRSSRATFANTHFIYGEVPEEWKHALVTPVYTS